MIAFHQYQRYQNVKMILDFVRRKNEIFTILEVGSGIHRNLEKFCEQDKIIYLEKNLPTDFNDNDNSIVIGDACNLNYRDQEFDIVVALDVYEHIEPTLRDLFLKEIIRVSKKFIILSAPFFSNENYKCEEELLNFAKNNLTVVPDWLMEHKQYGLPIKESLKSVLDKLEYEYFMYSHGAHIISNKLLKMELLSGICNDSYYYLQLAHEFYNNNIFMNDFCLNGIRTFFVISKNTFGLKELKELKDKIVSLQRTEYDDVSLANINKYERFINENYLQKVHSIGALRCCINTNKKIYDKTIIYRDVFWGKNYINVKNLCKGTLVRYTFFPLDKIGILKNLKIRAVNIEGKSEFLSYTSNDISNQFHNSQVVFLDNYTSFEFNVGKDVDDIILEFDLEQIIETKENLVDVLLITYNQENYIRQAIESVLAQKVNFGYRIIVCDDASTDNTISIIEEYAKKNPQKIFILPKEKNLGISKNYQRAFREISSKYVAILEGDDYWVNPYRLSYCVNYMEKNSDCNICANRIILEIEETGELIEHVNGISITKDTKFDGKDLALNNFIGNFSACFYKGDILKNVDNNSFDLVAYDWLINLICVKNTFIGYLYEPMSVYRIRLNGTWSSKSRKQQVNETIDIIDKYDKFLNYLYHESFLEHKRRLNKILEDMSIVEYIKDWLKTSLSAECYLKIKKVYHFFK